MAFCWVGRFRRSPPGMTGRWAQAGIFRPARKEGGERGFPSYSGTDPDGIQLGRIPIGGIIWYFQSMR